MTERRAIVQVIDIISGRNKGVRIGVDSPHAESALKVFSASTKDPQRKALLKVILDAFVNEEVGNVQVFTTRDGKAAVPYTRINLTDFARKIDPSLGFTTQKSADVATSEPVSVPDVRKRVLYVIFPSFPTIQNGSPFTFVELAMQQVIRNLPDVTDDLKNGKPVEDIEIITLGAPTNDKWGFVTPEYVDELEAAAFPKIGGSYAELVKKVLEKSPDGVPATVVLHGISMGASLASATGESLLKDSLVSQDRSSSKLPYLQVLMDSPVGLSDSPYNRQRQVTGGMILDGTIAMATSSAVRKAVFGEKGFLTQVAVQLAKRGLNTTQTPEQDNLKRRGVAAVVGQRIG